MIADEPAFPNPASAMPIAAGHRAMMEIFPHSAGMSLTDYFAGQVATSFRDCSPVYGFSPAEALTLARWAYQLADALAHVRSERVLASSTTKGGDG